MAPVLSLNNYSTYVHVHCTIVKKSLVHTTQIAAILVLTWPSLHAENVHKTYSFSAAHRNPLKKVETPILTSSCHKGTL